MIDVSEFLGTVAQDPFVDVWDLIWFAIGLLAGWFFIPTPRAILKKIKGD